VPQGTWRLGRLAHPAPDAAAHAAPCGAPHTTVCQPTRRTWHVEGSIPARGVHPSGRGGRPRRSAFSPHMVQWPSAVTGREPSPALKRGWGFTRDLGFGSSRHRG